MPYGVLRVTSHTCRVESLLDGNLYLILRPAVLNILDPSASRAADINGPRKSFQSETRPRRAADKEMHLSFAEMENIIDVVLSRNFDALQRINYPIILKGRKALIYFFILMKQYIAIIQRIFNRSNNLVLFLYAFRYRDE